MQQYKPKFHAHLVGIFAVFMTVIFTCYLALFAFSY